MANTKSERQHLSSSGCITFDGCMKIKVLGNEYLVRTDLGGIALSHADQNKEVIVLIRHNLPFNEIDTGFVVRAKVYDEAGGFGLKARQKDRHWPIYRYTDVVAWGYVDGGCNNPEHFASCQMRPEDYPQWASKPKSEDEEECKRECIKLRYENNRIRYHAVQPADKGAEHGVTPLIRDCETAFCDFRKAHPEVTEMHFYTDEDPLFPYFLKMPIG